MVKLARNEQCITLYPLTAHYSVGPFLAHDIFRPSQGPFNLGLISSIRLLTARYCHFLLVGQIQPVVTVGPLIRWAVFMSKKTRWAIFIELSNMANKRPVIVHE